METGKRALRKGILISIVALVVGVVALNGWALNAQDEKDNLLVTVEGDEITRGDVDQRIKTLLGARAKGLSPEQLAQIKRSLDQRVVQNMIIEALLTKAVKEQHIAIAEDEVNQVLGRLKASLPPDTDFQSYLKSIGFSEKDLAGAISKDLKIKKLLEAKVADVAGPTDAEIQQFYDDNPDQFKTPEGMSVRHILVSVTPDDGEMKRKEKLAKAEDIRKRLLLKGEDFAAVAAKESDCPSSAKGGNLGVVTRDSTVKPFEDAVFTRKVGDIGPVVKTQFGYHIIQVMNPQKAGMVPLAEAKPLISKQLVAQQEKRILTAYIDSLKNKAKIVYHDKALNAPNPA